MSTRGIQVSGDIALSADGTELLLTSGAAMVSQQIQVGAQIWKGSLSWDPDAGLPMFEEIVIKGPDFRVLRAIFRGFLLLTSGVLSVDELQITLNRQTRELSVKFKVTCESGESFSDVIGFSLQ